MTAPSIRLVDVRDGEALIRIKIDGHVFDFYLRHGDEKPLVKS